MEVERLSFRKLAVGMVSGLLLTFTAGQAAAVPSFTVYTSQALWQAAVSAFFTEDFNDLALQPGVSFTLNGSNHGVGGISGGVFEDIVTPGVGDTEWNFAFPIIGWGGTWDLAVPGGQGTGIDVLADGSAVSLSPSIINTTQGTFWGFVSDTPFTNVHLFADGQPEGTQETYTLENMVYAPVPEPATLFLVGSGMLGIAVKRRRGKH